MKTTPIQKDQRWTVTKEHTGRPSPQFVIRFCGEWIDSRPTYGGAVMRAVGAKAERDGALVVCELSKAEGTEIKNHFDVSVYTENGETFASVYHVPSGCGADFYKSGEELDWQDNNGLLASCPQDVVREARAMAETAISKAEGREG